MRRFALVILSLVLVGVLAYGCDETSPTESEAIIDGPSLSSRGNGLVSSRFDGGAEGWTLVGDANGAAGIPHVNPVGYSVQPYHSSTGGNPGGAIYAIDDAKGLDWYWQAPPKFLGNMSGAYGGTLSFEVKVPASPDFDRPDVILAGSDVTLVIDAGPSPSYPPLNWQHYSVRLAEGEGWKVTRLDGSDATGEQIRNVLRSLAVLRIRGEFYYGVDTGYLDNVRIESSRRRR